MAEFDIQIDTGAGLASIAYTPGFRLTLERLRPSRLSFTHRTNAVGHPWALDQSVALKDDDGLTTHFSGTLSGHGVRALRGRLRDVAFEAVGTDAILESGRVRVSRRYTDTAAGAIIKDICAKDLGAAFTTSAIVDGPTVPEIVFDGVSAREAFSRIEEISEGFALFVDAAAAITFDLETELSAAAFDVEPGGYNYDAGSLSIERGGGLFYNRVVIYAPEQQGEEIKEILPQAVNTNTYWAGKHPISSFASSGTNKVTDTTNTVSYSAKPRGTSGLSELDASYDFDFDAGVGSLRRITSMTAGNIDLQVQYLPRVPLVYALQDTQDIARRGGYPSGVWEAPPLFLDRVVPMEEAVDLAYAYLRRHSEREYTRVRYTVSEATTSNTVSPGQRQTITLPEEGIDGTFTIERVVYSDRLGGERFHMEVTAVQGVAQRSQRSLGQALRQQAGTRPDQWSDAIRETSLYAVPWRDDLEYTVSCTLADA